MGIKYTVAYNLFSCYKYIKQLYCSTYLTIKLQTTFQASRRQRLIDLYKSLSLRCSTLATPPLQKETQMSHASRYTKRAGLPVAFLALIGLISSMILSVPGTTPAQASETGPTISVSGKGCPKAAGSSWKRHMHISDKAKAKSKICTVKTNDGEYIVDLNTSYKFTKVNDDRFKVAIKITGYKYAHYLSDDGLEELWMTATADSAYLSGQGRYYMDEQGTAYYDSVPGKAFTISVRWWLTTTHRYWVNDLGQFVTDTDEGYVSMKTVKFTAVTKTK